MKKRIFAFVLCLALLLVPTAFAAEDSTKTASNKTALPDAPKYAFDVNSEEPMKPWPVVHMSYNVTIDYSFEFQRKEILDHEDSHPGKWTPVEPVELYQWTDGSWRSSVPTDVPATQLVKESFYLMEKGYYYRVIADFGGRTKNINPLYSRADYSMFDVYSGMLGAGRTGTISIELNESITFAAEHDKDANSVCVIHRAMLHVASIDGVNFTPRAYASNIDGEFIVTYAPSESDDCQDYYTQTTMDLILQQGSLEMPLYNVLC